jgi:hypothetical protein
MELIIAWQLLLHLLLYLPFNSYFTSIIDFTVVSHLEYDAVLGADGLAYVGPLVLAVFSQLSVEAF